MFHRREPTTSDALLTLKSAILSKACADYPFYGLPKNLSCDNHATYTSADFLDAVRRLGITKVEIPNAAPSANGKIERFFHTFKYGLLAKLAGYAGQYRGLAKAKEGAVPGALLPKIVRKFITEYHLKEHRALGTTPWEKWHEDIEHAHGLIVNESDVNDAIKLRREYQIHRDGIEVEKGRHFTGVCLSGLTDEQVTLLVSPEGRDLEIPAYYQNKLLGVLKCVEESAELADDIRADRLNRSIDIARLGRSLRGLIENEGVTTTSTDGQPAEAPSDATAELQKLKVPDQLPKADIPEDIKPLGTIPSVKADEQP